MSNGEFLEDASAVKLSFRDGGWNEQKIVFRVSKSSFAKGAMRSAHLAFIDNDLSTKFVAKRFLVPSDEDEEKYREDVRVQSIAGSIAEAFNRYNPPKQVKFVEAFLVRSQGVTYATEQMLTGEFVKHSNNAGFVDPHVRNTPHALSHFSWVFSQKGGPGKGLLISDVQGVQDFLTDPGIQSLVAGQYGKLDLGPAGVAFFFSTHECNAICAALGLPVFPTPSGQSPLECEHISLRKGKTLPKITRCLTKKSDLLVESASLPQPPFKPSKSSSQHLLLPLSEHVPKECTSDAIVCLSLAGLHEKGHLAEVYDLIRASNDGIASVSSTNKPSIEHALFYYQTAALGGHVEAQMIMAQVHAGFCPRDFLPDLTDLVDPKRAVYYLELAANTDCKSAVLHLADMKFAQENFAGAVELYRKAQSLSAPAPPEVDCGMPFNVWSNNLDLPHLYAQIAACYEKLFDWSNAFEYYNSAAEEAFANPLMAKKAMQWQEKAGACEGK